MKKNKVISCMGETNINNMLYEHNKAGYHAVHISTAYNGLRTIYTVLLEKDEN